MDNWTKEELDQAVTQVQEKASRDEAFRELCLRDIHAGIKEVMGKEVSSDLKIQVVDHTGYHMCLVLPSHNGDADELDEMSLHKIAGGRPVWVDERTFGKK